jgi:hypothetical protein
VSLISTVTRPWWAQPIVWALGLAALLAGLNVWQQLHIAELKVKVAVAQGAVETVRREAAEGEAAMLERFRLREMAKQKEAERIAGEDAARHDATVVRAAAAERAARSLRDEVARLNGRPAPEDPRAAAFAREAAVARELLGSCSDRYQRVAAEADQLRDQVIGLIDFATAVCPSGR